MSIRRLSVCIFATLAFGMPTPAAADGQYATGDDWIRSSPVEKYSYILGVSNLMSADYQLQIKNGQASGSAIPELFKAVENVTIEQAVEAIDAYLAENPEVRGSSVLDVIWLALVER